MRPVLVLDAETGQALAVVRGLAEKKIPVHIAGKEKYAPALWSSLPQKRFCYPSPLSAPRGFVKFLSRILAEENYEAVFPVTDSTVTVLQKFRSELPRVLWAMAGAESYQKVSDKFFAQELARQQGFTVPTTFYPGSLEELKKKSASFKFPVVLKPRYSRFYDEREEKIRKGETRIIFNQTELEKAFLESRQGESFPCIQEWVEGIGFGVEMLIREGEALAVFCHKRIREMDPLGSGSSVCESAPIRNDLVQASLGMLNACGYEGAAMVEFRIDERTGQSWFVEINGRFWGSLALPAACGINFPALYLQMLRGENIPSAAREYPAGVRACSFWREASRLLSALKGKPAGWPGPFPTRFQALGDFFESVFKPGQVSFDFQWKDPLPALVANLSFWLKSFSRLFRRASRKAKEEEFVHA